MAESNLASPNPVRERLTRVFQFIKALNEMRNPVQRQVTEQRWVLWFHELPDHPSITRGFAANPDDPGDEQGANTGFILKVRRPVLKDPPPPPAEIVAWLEPGWNRPDVEIARVRDSITEAQDGAERTVDLAADAERVKLLAKWQAARAAWVVSERPSRRAMQVFERLYELRSLLEHESERFELILGDGLLVWKRPEQPVHHPILLQRLQLQFDPSIPEFQLLEADRSPELYSALFRSMTDVSAQAIGALRDEIEEHMWHPLGGASTSEFLRRAAHQISPTHGVFVGDGEPTSREEGPSIGRAPVLFLRPKTLGFGLAIESILESLTDEAEIPDSLTSIVGFSPASWTPSAEDQRLGEIDPNGEDDDILLSKEANGGQLEIARRLARYGAVLVQGPPGTGKTHTIANLLGHLLAQGKSVLVTAHTAKALRVLREHVVEPLRPLCVSVLDGTSRQLEYSVDEISSHLAEQSEHTLDRQGAALSERRKAILSELRATRARLLTAREGEYRSITVAGADYSPSQAARLVAAGAASSSWIPSPVVPNVPMPLSAGELIDLYYTNEALTNEDQEELTLGLPDQRDLALPSDFERACIEQLQAGSAELNYRADLWTVADGQAEPAELVDLLDELTQAANELGNADPWQIAAIAAGQEGGPRRKAWEELLDEIAAVYQLAAEVNPLSVRFAPHIPVQWPPNLLSTLAEIEQHLGKGGKLGSLQLMFHPSWKAVLAEVQVNGSQPRLPEHFRALSMTAKLWEGRSRLRDRWERQMAELGGPGSDLLGEEPEQACHQFVTSIERALDWAAGTLKPLEGRLVQQGLCWSTLLNEVPPKLQPYADLLRLRTVVLESLPSVINAQLGRLSLAKSQSMLRGLRDKLDSLGEGLAAAATVRRLHEAVDTLNPQLYRQAIGRLSALKARQKALVLRHDLLAKVEAVAPAWAAAIRNREGVHAHSAPPADPEKAWTWRQLNDELDRRASTSVEELQEQCDRLRSELLKTTAELVEKKTWAAQIRRTTLEQRLALNGWKALMVRVGKRTGRRAPRLLAEARKLMPICQTAVPVWIMPLSQVVENFDPSTNRFDVVIIDEASQADVMALTALFMARQVVIVGDPEQVTPDAVGQRADEAQQLIDTFLTGIPNAQMYDGQTSIYDLAQTSFSGTVLLREHFRCVPDIIQFSNALSYSGRIQPLRDPSASRLLPHTLAYRVQGICDSRNVNEVEARTIASLLIAMTEQREYEWSTFGVISLVGAEQAAQIDILLRRFLPPDQYVRRRVQCGNAAQFQGDERDVVLLSMVHSPQSNGLLHRIPDPGNRMKKRFNVAASRARDQLWVVHSMDPDADLNADDIRRRLILHARNPRAAETVLEQLEPRTESEFEREVLRRLVTQGYKVTPQWRVGPYRIDMVVEDGPRRLAIECDGDKYHTAENLAEDMTRQAVLERLNWRFHRIRGSNFYRYPDEATKGLLAKLDALDIQPSRHGDSLGGDSESASTDLRERVVRRAAELRREWGYSDSVLPPGGASAAWRDVSAHVEQPQSAMQIEQHPTNGSGLLAEAPNPSGSPVRSRTLPVSPSKKASQILLLDHGIPEVGVAEGTHPVRSVDPAPAPSGSRPIVAVAEREGTEDIVEFLRRRDFEVVDKRASGGPLWVVGGWELSLVLNDLKAKGHKFTFAKNGSRSTGNRPAWFTK